MESEQNRRRFIGTAAATAAFTIVPRHVLGGPAYVAPSDKITLAHIGMGTEGLREMVNLLAAPEIQIVAVCDPNKDPVGYKDWSDMGILRSLRNAIGKADWRAGSEGTIPGGREVGKDVVDTYYAGQRGADKFAACNAYADFREMLEKEKDVDAVKIMTPDHLHATIAIAAMKRGKHVMMHKPIANRLREAKLTIDTARAKGVATHFLPWDSNGSMEQVMAWIKDGSIGALREVHNWTNRPVWPQFASMPKETPPVPEGFDWDLWLGPEAARPYHPSYTHMVFRGWYDFGGGSMADMGHYSLWPLFTGFDLGAPFSVQAWPTHFCSIVDQVSKPVKNDFSFPAGCTIQFKYAARGEKPPLDLFWYDGGMRPRVPQELAEEDKDLPIEGVMFIGDEGKIVAGFTGQNPQIYPKSRTEALGIPPAAPRGAGRPTDQPPRRELWLEAIKGGPPSPAAFPNASAISDCINLATVALRSGKKIVFDSDNMKIANAPEANKYLFREYRKGWEL